MLKKQVGNMAKTNYPVGDFLIKIKNAALARQKVVETDVTKFIKEVAKALEKEGYLESVEVKDGKIKARLSYMKKEPVLLGLKIVSKPGLRIYLDTEQLRSRKGPTTLILTTPKGVKSTKDALKEGLGGEAIVEIW